MVSAGSKSPIEVAAPLNSLKVLPLPQESTDNWVRLICQAWVRRAESFFELARLLSRARQSLPYGRWSRLWKEECLPFSKRKGEMLVVIGREMGELDAQNSAQLPVAWNTLYFLARLGRRIIERLIKEKRIHSNLSLQEAQSLLAEYRPQSRRKSRHLKVRTRLARFATFVRENLNTWPQAEQELACQELLALAGEIRVASEAVQDRRPSIAPTDSRSFDQPIAISPIL